MTIEIQPSIIRADMHPEEIATQIVENEDQVKALANLIHEFIKYDGVLGKKQIYRYSKQEWCSRPSFYRMLHKLRESGAILVSPNYSHYYLRAELGEALVQLGRSWITLVKPFMKLRNYAARI
jgi:hypothetical protein